MDDPSLKMTQLMFEGLQNSEATLAWKGLCFTDVLFFPRNRCSQFYRKSGDLF